MDNTSSVFGNRQPASVITSANRKKANFEQKFGDDSQRCYPLSSHENPAMQPWLGIRDLTISETGQPIDSEKGIIIGNIRMGYGHYRISMAIASAVNHFGYTPYWLDLASCRQTTGGKVIQHLNKLYSLGSRLSQKYPLFNRLFWEKLNSEGFRKLSFNAKDQRVSELMVPILSHIPRSMPFIGTHTWPAQAAVHAGINNVINVIPDNWPMALHLAEGARHVVQTPSSYFGYRMLNGMDKSRLLKPMPADSITHTGHFIDHELLKDLEQDCHKRLTRMEAGEPLRILLTVGGAGAQFDTFLAIIRHLLPLVEARRVCLFINVGDYRTIWDQLTEKLPELDKLAKLYDNEWDHVVALTDTDLINSLPLEGVHAFYHENIFSAVYSSNRLMRITDLMITKPSELAFYPVPKLMIKRVGGHEAYGAIRAAEIGDGTIEFEKTDAAIQMLQLFIDDKNLIKTMCENILRAHSVGVYDGAYKTVELAIKGSITGQAGKL
ncbi:hypothetical protein NX722_05195 [Endozoicomonas gorgoniicola]|uniref:Glycosyl transferase family 28 C-terminal domain-containing protein n=1 Tax=Endozoicomonas gorgoniicola TaxID=1234144 RepID=A0ABT3MRQ1_9GAMM|nr:hypothetical protein [Endozoicomonas gorgoniicola]MCW7552047.1 hypothetical protein [Endozoicomonas gorgoniicola]